MATRAADFHRLCGSLQTHLGTSMPSGAVISSEPPQPSGSTHLAIRHIRYRPCPVTSRIRPHASIQARLRWTAARLAPVRTSAIGAETSCHSVSTAHNVDGVLPESRAVSVAARTDQASISSSCLIAVRHAVCIPSSHRARRSAGGPPARRPPAPPVARGAKTAPLPSLAAIRTAVTAASIRSPCCPRPARLQR